MIHNVSTAAQLNAAIGVANSGDVIKLAAGDYGMISVTNKMFAGNVTITSADPARQAVLSGIHLKNSAGITLSNVEIAVEPNAAWNARLMVVGSERIVLDKLDVHGTVEGSPVGNGDLAMIRNSKDVTVSNSEFSQGKNALAFLDSDGVTIAKNSFHDLVTDGVRGGGTSNIKIVDNHFTDFYPQPGDHPDAIQFWTSNTTESARNILVEGNVITRGEGTPVQGIFFRDQVGDLPFTNVMVRDNFVSGTAYNGIGISGAKNLLVEDNVVIGADDQRSWIRVHHSEDVRLQDNLATFFANDTATLSGFADVGSRLMALPTDGGQTLLDTFLVKGVAGVATSVATMAPTIAKAAAASAAAASAPVASAPPVLTGTANGDKFVVGHSDTIIKEQATGGNDVVITSVDYTLGDNLERLELTGSAVRGIGNELDNGIGGNDLANLLRGLDGDDQLSGKGGDDTLDGGNGADYLSGGDGNDLLLGGDGDDRMLGEAGNDTLNGGDGNDALTGGAGLDVLTGGKGADKFMFGLDDFLSAQHGRDIITDFSRADGDKIALNGIDANVFTAAREKFTMIGLSAFGKVPGQLRYEVSNGDAIVHGDVNGDGVADFSILVKGVTHLQSSDFIL